MIKWPPIFSKRVWNLLELFFAGVALLLFYWLYAADLSPALAEKFPSFRKDDKFVGLVLLAAIRYGSLVLGLSLSLISGGAMLVLAKRNRKSRKT